jgi:hypothetical protein
MAGDRATGPRSGIAGHPGELLTTTTLGETNMTNDAYIRRAEYLRACGQILALLQDLDAIAILRDHAPAAKVDRLAAALRRAIALSHYADDAFSAFTPMLGQSADN